MTTTVVNIRTACLRLTGYDNLQEWMKDPNHVYIGRGRVVFIDGVRFPSEDSIFANPFRISEETDVSREESVNRFRSYIRKSPLLLKELESLRGKTLGCWCKPKKCHGDVLLELLAMNLSERSDN